MQEAAGRQDFESAAVFRDRLDALRHVLERQQIESSSLGSADITGLAVDDWGANVQVFITRDGKLCRPAEPHLRQRGGSGRTGGLRTLRGRVLRYRFRCAGGTDRPGGREPHRQTGRLPGGTARDEGRRTPGGAGRQAAAAGAGRPERRAGPGSRAAARGAEPGASSGRADGVGERAGSGGPAHAHRGLRHLEPGSREHRGLDGGLRGGSGQEERLPQVRHQVDGGAGRCGRHPRGACPTFHPRSQWRGAESRARRLRRRAGNVFHPGRRRPALRPLVRGGARPGADRRRQGATWGGDRGACARRVWRRP